MTLLAVCISEHRVLTVLEQAAVVGCRAFVNFMNIIGYKPAVLWLDQDWWRWPSSTIPLLLFPHQEETKPPSSKQQGTLWLRLSLALQCNWWQASFPHGSSRGCESTFAHTTHFNSSRTVVLFWLDNGGDGREHAHWILARSPIDDDPIVPDSKCLRCLERVFTRKVLELFAELSGEFIGTFLLTLIITTVVATDGCCLEPSISAPPYFSNSHLNPAVTLAFGIVRWRVVSVEGKIIPYLLIQVLGGFLAAATDQCPGASKKQRWPVPVLIGLTVAVIIALYAPLTQAGLNPARDFGPRLFALMAGWGGVAIPGPRNGSWVYIVGPIIGGPSGASV
eukprot:Em0007g1458a